MDLERIEALIEVIKDARVSELAVKTGGMSVSMRKSPKATAAAASRASHLVRAKSNSGLKTVTAAEPEIPAGTVITAPMVGIYHAVEELTIPGSTVKKGQVVGSIESMKLMNDVKAPEDGTVAEVYAVDGTPVEYGQSLIRVVKD